MQPITELRVLTKNSKSLATDMQTYCPSLKMSSQQYRFLHLKETFDNDLLTPSIFKKLEYQYELYELIEFAVIEHDSAITATTKKDGHTVTEQHCTCMYFSAMEIPCQHLFQFWLTKNMELFKPDLCATRWTKSYYYDSHPAINSFEYVAPRPPTHVVRVRCSSSFRNRQI